MPHTMVTHICQYCQNPFGVRLSLAKRGGGKFCSVSCSNNAKKKPKTTPDLIRCTKCQLEKEPEAFYRQTDKSNGRQSQCKECVTPYQKDYYANHKETSKERARAWHADHREFANERSRRWRNENLEAAKQHDRDRYLLRRDESIARASKWQQNNPIKARQKQNRWRKENPEKFHGQISRRQAKEKGASRNDLTAADWLIIKKQFGFRCAYCGEKKPLTRDHIIPLSKGGGHTLSNIVPACRSCNSKKGTGAPLKPVQPLLL